MSKIQHKTKSRIEVMNFKMNNLLCEKTAPTTFSNHSRSIKYDTNSRRSVAYNNRCSNISLAWLMLFVNFVIATGFLVVADRICSQIEISNDNLKGLELLRNCDIINGSLTISMISVPNINNYIFPIREINGYLFLYRVDYLISIGILFPNLTIIRGFDLFANRYSFVVHENLDLKNLGLTNLVKITQGSVQINKNPELCYINTINWLEILENIQLQEYSITENHDHCPICKRINTIKTVDKVFDFNFCWNYKNYQRKIQDDKNGCLLSNSETTANCLICKNFKNLINEACVEKCNPLNSYEFDKKYCISEDMCKNKKYLIYKHKCVASCPHNFKKIGDKCIECENVPGKCYRNCDYDVIIRSEEDAKVLEKCSIVNGSIIIELRLTKTKINLEQYMSDIKEIKGFLKVSKSPQIENLYFLNSLKMIQGEKVFENRYSVYITENEKLENLWLEQQNVQINNGTGYYHMNPKLCIKNYTKCNFNFINQKDKLSIVAPPNSNGEKTVCDENFQLMDAIVEDYNATAVRIKLEPWNSYERRCLIGYYFYYLETTENISYYGGFHCCGNNNWQMNLVLTINVRHVIRNLKPNTRYAYFVRAYTINEYHIKKDAISKIQYFTTKYLKPEPVEKFFFNIVNSMEIEIYWWPPQNHDYKITHYKINCTRIEKPTTRYDTIDKDNNLKQCPQYDWINESPSAIKNITDFYTEYLQFDDNVPNMVYFKKNVEINEDTKKILEEVVPEEFPKNEDLYINNPVNSYYAQKELENVMLQDNGSANFPIEQQKMQTDKILDFNSTNSSTIISNIYEVNGRRNNFTLHNLNPNTLYFIAIRACTEINLTLFCGPDSWTEARTPQVL